MSGIHWSWVINTFVLLDLKRWSIIASSTAYTHPRCQFRFLAWSRAVGILVFALNLLFVWAHGRVLSDMRFEVIRLNIRIHCLFGRMSGCYLRM